MLIILYDYLYLCYSKAAKRLQPKKKKLEDPTEIKVKEV